MADWFESGRGVDLVLIVLALEAAGLRARLGPRRWRDILAGLAPGLLLLLALRAALTGAPWWEPALFVTLSLPAHVYDLARRGWLKPHRAER